MARIFLCHASEDKARVRDVYQRLQTIEGLRPWLDEEDILPGQVWADEIPRALKESDFILIFLSQNSVAKSGYVQREMRLALDALQATPPGTIHTIPVRLDDCDVPEQFRRYQYADLFAERGFERIVLAIRAELTKRAGPPSAPHDSAQFHSDITLPGGVPPQDLQPKPEGVPTELQPTDLSSEELLEIRAQPETPVINPPQPGKSLDDNPSATRRTMLWSAVIGAIGLMIAAVIGLYEPLTKPESSKPIAKGTGRESSAAKAPSLPPTFTGQADIDFVLIKAGEFQMGSEKGDSNERPVHTVRITQPFYLSKYEITQAQWQEVMGDNPSRFKDDPKHPVEGVSWDMAQAFIRKLNKRDGRSIYRLPTEAEWEYAARASSTTAYHFGDDEAQLGDYAWYSQNSGSTTHPVGEKQANAWGLYDMHGNVWEWVQDRYGPYVAESVTNPVGPDAGAGRVIRGGGWNDFARVARSASRDADRPGLRDDYLGFRCLSSGPSE